MMTPSGAECAHYYEDFQRGANRQECRAPRHPRSTAWQPTDCARCPVPGILAANGSPRLDLRITVRTGMLGFGRRVEVEAWCLEHGPITGDPHVGCAVCNAEADELLRAALD
ncbi:MAG TPA: hypothetical protein VLQ52_04195 [Coriobacteriia bacterium]|nr:hypothetical protein [Coriobacteriia bacterium]